MNINVKIRNKRYILSTKLSNHNIAMMEFVKDGIVISKNNPYFKGEGHNLWVRAYIGPRWKRLLAIDNQSTGATDNPLEGLIACKKMLIFFIDNIMGPKDLIEISGSTIQRDKIYHEVLSKIGFRFVKWYGDYSNIMIYVKDNNTDEYIKWYDDSKIINSNNPWGALRICGVDFPKTPNYEEDDYNYTHHTIFYDMLMTPVIKVGNSIRNLYYNCSLWIQDVWLNIKYKIQKYKFKKHRV